MLNNYYFQYPNLNLKVFNSLAKYNFILFIVTITCFQFSSRSFSQPLATGNKKFVGNIINDPNNVPNTFSIYWDQVTPGNAGKWGSIQGTDTNAYNWTPLDKVYNYAVSHGYPFKEHNLIWNSQQPGFMTNGSLDSLQEYRAIVRWIDTCGQRYPKAAFVDVVNEPIDHAPPYKNALGGNGTTGWDWVIKAFELARQYWPPTTKLLINEYNVINNASRNATYIQIINLLKDRGLIDGIGVQAHSFEVDGPSVSTLKTYLDKLAATGLPVYISEFSINESNDNTQLQKYNSIFPMLYEDPGVKGITLWGYIEYDMWSAEPNAYLITDRNAERPAIQWLRTYLTSYLHSNLISPVGTTLQPRNPILIWNKSTAAKSYYIQLSLDSSFTSTVFDSTVADTVVQLDTLTANTIYYWHIAAFNLSDTGNYSVIGIFKTGDQITGIKDNKVVPKELTLLQNYPNPFNPTTIIRYSIPKAGLVTLNVYDILGQKITTIINKEQTAGWHDVNFNATKLTSGVYIYRIEAGRYVQVKKMMVLK